MRKELVILMAEDNKGHFVLTKSYFARQGVQNQLIWLADGEEALNFLFLENGDVRSYPGKEFILFLDIRMPKIDGWEVLRRIRDNSRLEDMPVVMLTAMENPEQIERGKEMGCSAYIIKPVKYSSYIDAMKKVGVFPTIVPNGVELVSKKTA